MHQNRINKLTISKIKAARATSRQYTLSDGNRLFLLIKPNRNKVWMIRYISPVTHKRVVIEIGKFPELSLKSARFRADKINLQLQQRRDPWIEQQHEQEANQRTFSVITTMYKSLKESHNEAKYAADLESRLGHYVLPLIGNRPVHKITVPQLIEVLKLSVNEMDVTSHRRVVKDVTEVMNYAHCLGFTPHNACFGLAHGERYKLAFNQINHHSSGIPHCQGQNGGD